MNEVKAFRWFLLGLFLVILVSGGFFIVLKQNKKEAPRFQETTWQEYTSPYGYQISYPSNWSIFAGLPHDGWQRVRLVSPEATRLSQTSRWSKSKEIGAVEEMTEADLNPLLYVTTFNSLEQLLKEGFGLLTPASPDSLKSALEELTRQEANQKGLLYSAPQAIQLNQEPAFWLTATESGDNQANYLFLVIEKQGFYYLLRFNGRNSISQLETEEQRILNSFQLIQSAKTEIKPDLAEGKWKEYSDQKWGIKFRVPANWKIQREAERLVLASPFEIENQEWCQLMKCDPQEAKGARFWFVYYQGLEQLKKEFQVESTATSLEDYLKEVTRAKEGEGIPFSYQNIQLGQSNGFKVTEQTEVPLTLILIPVEERIFEAVFPCQNEECLQEVDEKILNSLVFS